MAPLAALAIVHRLASPNMARASHFMLAFRWPPIRLPGEDLVKSKKSKLPLDQIMWKEKKGGWGRSIRGAETAVQKLNKTMEFAHYALDLQAQLDLVAKARKLQAHAISGLQGDALEEILRALQKANVDLHTDTTHLLLQRRAQRLVEVIGKNTADDANQRLEELMQVMNPFDTKDCEKFDPLNPRLANLPGCGDKAQRFTQVVVEEPLISMITSGDAKAHLVHKFAAHVISSFGALNMLSLDSHEAQCVTDLLDIAKALSDILGSLVDALHYKADIMTLKESFGASVSESLVALVAQAVKQNEDYNAKVDLFLKSEPALAVVVPLIRKRSEELAEGCDIASGLQRAAELIVSHEATVPVEVFRDFHKLVHQRTDQYNSTLLEASGAELKKESDIYGSAMDKLNDWAAILRELGLAFPMAEWVHNMSEEVAAHLRDGTQKCFKNEMIGIMKEIEAHLDDKETPPTEKHMADLQSVLSRASAGNHFKVGRANDAIKSCFLAYEKAYKRMADLNWLKVGELSFELSAFIANGEGTLKLRSNLVLKSLFLLQTMKAAENIANDSSWRDKATDTLRGKAMVKDLLSKLSAAGDAQASDQESFVADLIQVAEQTVATADAYIQKLMGVVKVLFGHGGRGG